MSSDGGIPDDAELDEIRAELDASAADLSSSLDEQLDELPSGKDGLPFSTFAAYDIVSCRRWRQRKRHRYLVIWAKAIEGEPGVCNPGFKYLLIPEAKARYFRSPGIGPLYPGQRSGDFCVHERDGEFTTDDGRRCEVSLAKPADPPRFFLGAPVRCTDDDMTWGICRVVEVGCERFALRDYGRVHVEREASDVGGIPFGLDVWEPLVSGHVAQAAEQLRIARRDEQPGT